MPEPSRGSGARVARDSSGLTPVETALAFPPESPRGPTRHTSVRGLHLTNIFLHGPKRLTSLTAKLLKDISRRA